MSRNYVELTSSFFVNTFNSLGDTADGECKQEVCTNETKPECIEPSDQCISNTPQCVNETWACIETSKDCQDGFTCKSHVMCVVFRACLLNTLLIHTRTISGNATTGICEEDNMFDGCDDELKLFCVKSQVPCMTNTSQCVDEAWACVYAPVNCSEGQYCKCCDNLLRINSLIHVVKTNPLFFHY